MDRPSSNGHNIEEEIDLLPEGMIEDENFNRKTFREVLDNTLNPFIQRIKLDIQQFGGVNIIAPLDGSAIALFEFTKLLSRNGLTPEDIRNINFVYSAKIYSGNSKRYTTSQDITNSYPVYILDDIMDSGESSRMIKEATGINDITVVSLSSKAGRNFKQFEELGIPFYEFRDLWIMSSLGMNSGQFDLRELQLALLANLITQEQFEELLEVHQEIEVYERMCAKVYYKTDLKDLPWRFNLSECTRYLEILKKNCFYEDSEKDYVYGILKSIQQAQGADKFEYMNLSK